MVHKIDQPGLHEHSHRPEADVMKPFIIWRKTKSGAWLAVESQNTLWEALSATKERRSYPERYPGTPTHPSDPQTYRITHDHPNGKRYLFVYIGENPDALIGGAEIVYSLTEFPGSSPTYIPYDLIHTTDIKNY